MPAGGSNSDKNKKTTLRSASATTDFDMDTLEAALQKQSDMYEKLLDKQADSFQKSLLTIMEATNGRIDKMSMMMGELKASLEFTQKDVAEFKAEMSKSKQEERKIHDKIEVTSGVINDMKKEMDYLENQSRRNNLRIDGIPEGPDESWAKTEELVREMLTNKLSFPTREANDIGIERAHRIGTKRDAENDRPRTIMVKMEKFKDRDTIKQKAKECKVRGLFINEDYSQRVAEIRKDLLPKLKQARSEGKIAYFSLDKLIIKDRY